jgi:hypothetical protein
MNIPLDSCPYCRESVSELSPDTLVCLKCGKKICADRTAQISLIGSSKSEKFETLEFMLNQGLYKDSLILLEELMDEKTEDDANLIFLHGIINAYLGEDGRAFNDWKKSMEMIGDGCEFDTYMCSICKMIAEMMYDKESEYIEFDFVRYINRMAQLFSDITGCSIKAFTFYTVYINYLDTLDKMESKGKSRIAYVIPKLFRNVVVYYRNYPNLRFVVEQYLDNIGYDRDTYGEDGMEQCHLYDLVSDSINHHCKNLSVEYLECVRNQWTDEDMIVLDEYFAKMESIVHDNMRKKLDIPLDEAIYNYTRMCLKLDCQDE